jgi:hypothetical protein
MLKIDYLKTRNLIEFGLRPQQVRNLTGASESRVATITKEIKNDGCKLPSKGLLSANKILRTKARFRQMSLWMIIYQQVLTAECDFQRQAVPSPWHSHIDSNILLKTQLMFLELMENEFQLNPDVDDMLTVSECLNVLTEINSTNTTYLATCESCYIEYVVVESSKHTDNCPFCQERQFECERTLVINERITSNGLLLTV